MGKTGMALCTSHEIGFVENPPQMPVISLAFGNKVATKPQPLNVACSRTTVEGVRGSPLLIFFIIAIKWYQECYTVTHVTELVLMQFHSNT